MKKTALLIASIFATSVLLQPAVTYAAQQKKTASVSKKSTAKTKKRTPAPRRSVKKSRSKAAAQNTDDNTAQKKGLESQQKALQQQIGKLQRDISLKQAKQQKEASAAKSAQSALTLSNKKLQQLTAEQKQKQSQIASNKKESGRVTNRLENTRRDIATNARIQYLYSKKKPWEVLVSGSTPAEIHRGNAILDYLAERHQKRANNLEVTKVQLKNQEQKTTAQAKNIAANAATEQQSNQKLAADQKLHQDNTKKLEQQIASQKQQVAELKKDQQRLSALIQQINAAIAAQERARQKKLEAERLARKKAAEERARQLALAKKKAAQQGKPAPKAPERVEEPPEPAPAPSLSGNFAKLRGRMPMPVSGTVEGRYDQNRNGIGKWQGLFIRAQEGSAVKAIAAGRVVYSGNLRGFGNLIILDHGSGYLSVYAYNSALLKGNGSSVSAGETIARSGSGAIGDTPGLYFEIRYKGHTINPSSWVR